MLFRSVCLGTMTFGEEFGWGANEEESRRIFDAFLTAGGNFIDTARVYSDWIPGETQRSEKIIGEWLAARSVRSRIVLATAGGSAYMPDGVVRIDAEIDGAPAVGARPVYTAATLPDADKPMSGDSRTVWALALWLQALTLLSVAAIWSWHRWGKAQTWVEIGRAHV